MGPGAPNQAYPGKRPPQGPWVPREKINFGETLITSWRVFTEGFVTIAGLGLPSIFTLFVYAITSSMSSLQFSQIFSIFQFILLLACFWLPVCLHCSIALYVHGSLKNSPPTFSAALAGGLERITQIIFFYFRLLILMLLFGSITAGLVFLSDMTSPAIAISVTVLIGSVVILFLSKFCVLFAASVVEKINVTQAMVRSWHLSKGNFLSVFLATIIALAALTLIIQGTRKIIVITSENLIVYLFIIIVSIFLISLVSTIVSVVYCKLKISDESYNITLESIVFDEVQIPYKK
jgi:hypothetical protein